MPNHTVVAVYEKAAQAAAAVNDLQAAHVLPDAISQHTKTLTASGTTHSRRTSRGSGRAFSAAITIPPYTTAVSKRAHPC
jgi:hypothetical protein